MYDWQHYIPLLTIKPGSLRNGAPFIEMPEVLRRLQHHLLKREGGAKEMASILATVPIHGLDEVLIAVELAFEAGNPSSQHVMNILSRLKPHPAFDELHDVLVPQLIVPAQANVERYDRLWQEKPHEQRYYRPVKDAQALRHGPSLSRPTCPD